MAQSFITDAGALIIPGAYPSIKVAQANSGLATTGVLFLVGEAMAGPDFSQEADLSLNSFGPDQLAEVTAKYKGGPLVDAFRGAVAAANDPQIQGSFSRAILVKTNNSTKASGTLKKWDDSDWATVEDRSWGRLGNLIVKEVVAKQNEVVPTTGKFAFLPPIASTNIDVRVNGGEASAITIGAQATPAAFKVQIDAVPGVDVSGGVNLEVLGTALAPIDGQVSLTVVSGNTVRIDFDTDFNAIPTAGDTLWIPVGSVLAGGSNQNCGSYIVTGAESDSITARKLIDATGTPNQLTAPVNVSAVAVGASIAVDYATIAALPACTPAGTGIGHTLTGNSNGALSVDGTAVLNGDRILVKNQVSADDNGVYVVTDKGDGSNPFVLTRATDADTAVEFYKGLLITVSGGATLADTTWRHTTSGSITIDTTNLTFAAVTELLVDLVAYSAMEVHAVTSVDPIDGIGKTLEINELTTGTGLLSYLCYKLGTGGPTAVTWISKASAPKVINSGAEYIAQLNASRQFDAISEELSAGGGITLLLSYVGDSATVENDGTTLTINVEGGDGEDQSIKLSDYPTIADLATFISTLTGFKAAPGTAVMGQQATTSLDRGTFSFASTFGAYTGRIKQDAYKFFTKVANDAVLVELDERPDAGLPAPEALGFLSGGTVGSTTNTTFNAAIDALELCRGNFVIPLFSRDAVDDIADNLTDTSSSYTIANVHAYTRAHVLKMSTLKRRRNRQCLLSTRDSFVNARETAANIASFRACMNFQDIRDVGAAGIVQFQPWMGAVKAASMQAAGFYRPIVHKGIAISGALQAAGDFNDQNDTQMEDALLAGLLPIRRDENGGFIWVSDQTTYGKDNNFVFNSLQATYVADVIALSTAQRMEAAFVGQSVADVSASLALSTLEAIMDDLRRLKLIAPSDDAPKGFKNASVKISGPAMVVTVEVKLAGAIYFIPIQFLVSQVQQSAG